MGRAEPVNAGSAGSPAPTGTASPVQSGEGVYEVWLSTNFGRIWTSKPRVQANGLLTVLRNPKRAKNGSQAEFLSNTVFTAVALSLRAETLATVDNYGNVFLFHIHQNRFARLDRTCHAGTALAFASRNKGELYGAFADNTVRVYRTRLEARQCLATLKGHRCPVSDISTSSNGDLLLTTSAECINIWDTKCHTLLHSLGSGPYGALQAAYTPDGESIVTSFKDDSISVWDARDCSHRVSLKLPGNAPVTTPGCPMFRCIAISPDQRWLVAAGATALLYCWDMRGLHLSYALALPLPPAQFGTVQLHFMPDSRIVAVLTYDGTLQFIDVLEGDVVYKLEKTGAGHAADHVAIDGAGNHAGLVTKEGEIRLYDLFTLRKAFDSGPLYRLKKLSPESLVQSSNRFPLSTIEHPNSAQPGFMQHVGMLPGIESYDSALLASNDEEFSSRKWRQTHATAATARPSPRAIRRLKQVGSSSPAKGTIAGLRLGTPTGHGLSRKRLRALLDAYGEYPEKYRVQIWQFLLQVPHNTNAHETLQLKGIHASFKELGTKYPLQSRALMARLQRVLSCLAYWTPILGEVEYLPAIVFPFLKLFRTDECACFEVVATLLSNWAEHWFELLPHPPLPLLAHVEALLRHWDPELAATLEACLAGGYQAAAWTCMQTLLTELLSRQEWLKVWDHIFTNDTYFLYYLLVAIFIRLRQSIIAAASSQKGSMLASFFRRGQPIDINKAIRSAYELRRETPVETRPQSSALRPIPPGDAYPVFQACHPKVVDHQIAERVRLETEEQALLRRRQLVADLERRTRSMSSQEATWAAEKQKMAALERERATAIRQQEEALRLEMARLDDKSKEERLRQIDIIEATFRKNIDATQEQWARELERITQEVDRKRNESQAQIQRRVEEEAIKALEFQAAQRMWSMQEEEQRNAIADRLQHEVAARSMVADMEFEKRVAEWDGEDKQRLIAQQHEAARRARLASAKEEARLQQAVDTELFRSELERDLGAKKVEMERKLRQAAEEEAARTAEALEAERIREEVRRAEESALVVARAEEDQAWYDSQSMRRSDKLAREEAARKREVAERAAMINEVERAGRTREAEGQLLERRRMLERQNLAEEREVARMLDLLQEERGKDRRLMQDLTRSEKELESRLLHARRVATEQHAVEEEERSQFDALRGALAMRKAEMEAEQVARHERLMAQLAVERERALLELDGAWRKAVARGEMSRLQEESAAFAEAKTQMEAAALSEERQSAREVARLRRRAVAAKVAVDPFGAAAAAAAGAGLIDSTSHSSVTSPTNSSVSDEVDNGGDDNDDDGDDASGRHAPPSPVSIPPAPSAHETESSLQARDPESSTTAVSETTTTTTATTRTMSGNKEGGSSSGGASRPPSGVVSGGRSSGVSTGGDTTADEKNASRQDSDLSPQYLLLYQSEADGSSASQGDGRREVGSTARDGRYKWSTASGSNSVARSTGGASSVTLTPGLSAAARYAQEAVAAHGGSTPLSEVGADAGSSSPTGSPRLENLIARLAALGIGPDGELLRSPSQSSAHASLSPLFLHRQAERDSSRTSSALEPHPLSATGYLSSTDYDAHMPANGGAATTAADLTFASAAPRPPASSFTSFGSRYQHSSTHSTFSEAVERRYYSTSEAGSAQTPQRRPPLQRSAVPHVPGPDNLPSTDATSTDTSRHMFSASP